MHGRMHVSRLNFCRIVTIGLKYEYPLPLNSGRSSASASFFGFDVIAPNSPSLCLASRSTVRGGSAFPSLHQHSQPMSA